MSMQESTAHVRDRLEKGSGEAWKIVKDMSGSNCKATNQIKDGGKVLSSAEAANGFNKYFVSKIEMIREGIGRDKFVGDPLTESTRKLEDLASRKMSLPSTLWTRRKSSEPLRKPNDQSALTSLGLHPLC
jgi:hypothetical protein